MMDWLHDPSNNRAMAWIVTLVALAGAVTVWFAQPGYAGLAIGVAAWLILFDWDWFYSEWRENALEVTPREVLGRRALLIRLRIALGGALAGFFVTTLICLGIGLDIGPRQLGWLALGFGLAVPLSFRIPAIERMLVEYLCEVVLVPFRIAILWQAATREDWMRDAFYKRLNARAKTLFRLVSGYRSNLSFLHEADAIVAALPVARAR